MAKFEKSIIIAAPTGEVFDYVQQPERLCSLLPISDLTFLTHMHRGVGTRVRYGLDLGSKQVVTECSLGQVKVDESVKYHSTTGVMFDWDLTIDQVEGGTQLRWQGEYEAPLSFLDRVLGRGAAIQQAMESAIDDSLRKLKEALESE